MQQSKVQITYFILFIPFVFACILYFNTLDHSYVLDDKVAITGNRFTQQGIKGIPELFTTNANLGFRNYTKGTWRPLSLITFAIEYEFWGNNPRSGHFINFLLYGISGIVLLLLLLQFFPKENPLIPLFVTLLFIAHPLHTEVVANIKGRDEILCFLNVSLSLMLTLKYIKSPKIYLLFSALFLFFLALLSKENAVTFLAVIPLTLYFFGAVNLRKVLKITSLFVCVFMVYIGMKYHYLNSVLLVSDEYLAGLFNPLYSVNSLGDRLATAIYIMGKYLQLLIVPHPLVHDYSYNQIPIVQWFDPKVLLSFLIYTALLLYAVFNFKKRDPIAYGILYFFITASIVSNIFILISAGMAERYMYLPSLGFCIVLVFLMVKWLNLKIDKKQPFRILLKQNNFKVFTGLCMLILMGFSYKTISRNKLWKDELTLFSNDAGISKNSAVAQLHYGTVLLGMAKEEPDRTLQAQLIQESLKRHEIALNIYPNYYYAYNNLGMIYKLIGKYDLAEENYLKLLQINPELSETHYNLGNLYSEIQKYGLAISSYQKAIHYHANHARSYNNLANVYVKLKNFDTAIIYFKEALSIDPKLIDCYNNLGIIYELKGDLEQAGVYYATFKKLNNGV